MARFLNLAFSATRAKTPSNTAQAQSVDPSKICPPHNHGRRYPPIAKLGKAKGWRLCKPGGSGPMARTAGVACLTTAQTRRSEGTTFRTVYAETLCSTLNRLRMSCRDQGHKAAGHPVRTLSSGPKAWPVVPIQTCANNLT